MIQNSAREVSAIRLRQLSGVATALSGLIFVLISLGGLVRNAGAGLSCPDWPLCFGQFIPPMNVQVFLEWFHRLIAGTVSVILLTLSAVIFISAPLRRAFGKYCAVALVLLATQVVLGGLTVLGLLSPKWVTSHLAVGLAFFATIFFLSLRLTAAARSMGMARPTSVAPTTPVALRRFGLFTGVIVYLQVILGGLVSSHYAGLACPDFPTCLGQWLPPLDGAVALQFFHRVGAFVVTAAVILFFMISFKISLTQHFKRAVRALPGFLILQLLLGIGAVFMKLPLPMSVAHLMVATALFGTLIVVNHELQCS